MPERIFSLFREIHFSHSSFLQAARNPYSTWTISYKKDLLSFKVEEKRGRQSYLLIVLQESSSQSRRIAKALYTQRTCAAYSSRPEVVALLESRRECLTPWLYCTHIAANSSSRSGVKGFYFTGKNFYSTNFRIKDGGALWSVLVTIFEGGNVATWRVSERVLSDGVKCVMISFPIVMEFVGRCHLKNGFGLRSLSSSTCVLVSWIASVRKVPRFMWVLKGVFIVEINSYFDGVRKRSSISRVQVKYICWKRLLLSWRLVWFFIGSNKKTW